ncbi:hypothetical protein BU17DRAFT_57014, partial [Hysterangium stoloniferum]
YVRQIKGLNCTLLDNPLTYEAFLTPDLTYTLVKPLESKYVRLQREGNLAVVFCFLLNRVHFIRDESFSTVPLSRSRAALCEILAIRAMRFHSDNVLELTTVLTTSWPLFAGASPEVLRRAEQEEDMDVEDSAGNAIEMAILGKAKRFIKSSPCQKVIDAIWSGKCVYQAESSHSILSDNYKRTPVHFYNPHTAPLLDHYRLKIPAVRSVLEYINFVVLFVLLVFALEYNALNHINLSEGLFMLFALGFSLEKLASIQEHGLRVYVTGTWNGFDVLFISVFGAYMSLRVWGMYNHNDWAMSAGIDCLAVAACLIFPRLAFVTLSNNLMILSLRSMFLEFAVLMAIATFCFAGFLYALWTLSRTGPKYTLSQIAWWMLDLFFGLDSSGFDKATTFHPVLGPFLMISYACLSNTLLLTVLVSILSHTFSTISSDAAAEAMYRRAVSTIEGVKADALFSYQPPLNLFALIVMLPASYILTPRWFHKVNVFMIRLTSFPILLCISLYERQKSETGAITFYEYISESLEMIMDKLPKGLKKMAFFDGLKGSGSDIDAVFDIEDEITLAHEDFNQNGNQGQTEPIGLTPKKSSLQNSPGASERPRVLPQHLSDVAEALSPLAQAYGAVWEEDTNENQALSSSSQQQQGISFGEVTRRRLSSMVHTRRASDSSHPFPRRMISGSPTREVGRSPPSQKPKKVTQLESESEMLGEDGVLEKRLVRIEVSQRRIEEMLIQLTTKK